MTSWMNFFGVLFRSGEVSGSAAYCALEPYFFGIVWIWLILWFAWSGVVEVLQGIIDVSGHGDVD